MANFQLNNLIKQGQMRTLIAVVVASAVVLTLIISLLAQGKHKKVVSPNKELDITGIVDESFTEANAESAMTAQQSEFESLKKEMTKLHETIGTMMKTQEEQITELNKTWQNNASRASMLVSRAARTGSRSG